VIRNIKSRVDVIRNGVKISELKFPITNAPRIRMNNDSELKSSLSGTFYPNDMIDWYADELRPVISIDGEEKSMGIFRPATVSKQYSETGLLISVEAYDRCWILQARTTDDIIHLSSGTNYLQVIKEILTGAGIALVIDTPTNETLRMDREDWEIGTSYLKIINQLLSEINYNEIWFNSQGYAVLDQKHVLDAANIQRTYSENDSKTLMISNTRAEVDLFNAPNVFICVCSNPDDNSVMKAVAENNNPASPTSIIRRGMRIYKMQKVDNIASLSALEEYAQMICRESMMLSEKLIVRTAIMPDCGINEVVALAKSGEDGICVETAWEASLMPGAEMTHTLEKVIT